APNAVSIVNPSASASQTRAVNGEPRWRQASAWRRKASGIVWVPGISVFLKQKLSFRRKPESMGECNNCERRVCLLHHHVVTPGLDPGVQEPPQAASIFAKIRH